MKKADEMEMYINLKSLRIAWVFTVICLLVWSIYDYAVNAQLGLPFILLLTQEVVFWSCTLYLRHKLSGQNEE